MFFGIKYHFLPSFLPLHKVNKDLETLEERRLISSKAQDAEEVLAGLGEAGVGGYTSAPEIRVATAPSLMDSYSKSKANRKRSLKDFQNCRSLVLEDEFSGGKTLGI